MSSIPLVFTLLLFTLLNGHTAESTAHRNKPLTTTGEHPFYVKKKGWICAKDLKEKDLIRTDKGSYISIINIHRQKKGENTVYNMMIDETHSYYITKKTKKYLLIIRIYVEKSMKLNLIGKIFNRKICITIILIRLISTYQ